MTAAHTVLVIGRRAAVVVCVFVWIIAFTVSHAPLERLPDLHTSDKTLHFVGFFVLGSVFFLTLVVHGGNRWRRIGIVSLIMFVYALVDELTQPLVNRHADVLDFASDLVGAMGALVVWELLLITLRVVRRIVVRRTDVS